jgi:cytochrome c-type biogenesis protein CcmH/NrfG
MTASEKEYLQAQTQRRQRTQRIFALISVVGFAGSLVFGMVSLYSSAFQSSPQPIETISEESEFTEQIQGYQKVLEREPDNQAALEGLVSLYLKNNDFPGAIEPLEKLVKLSPDRQDYQTLLAQLKKEASSTSAPAQK